MTDRRRKLPRREFLGLLGLAAAASACGVSGSELSSTATTAGPLRPLDDVTPTAATSTTAAPPSTTPPGAAASPAISAPTTSTPPSTAATTTTTEVPSTTTSLPATTTTSTTSTTTTSTTSAPTTTSYAPGGPATLRIRPREDWGAREPDTSLLVPHSGSMRYLTVHHAGGTSGSSGPARYRSWQNFHMNDRGWGDIAYHYIIGKTGIVWEARDVSYRGDTGTSYDPDRHFLVVVEGNFEGSHPTAEQLERLPVVLAWGSQTFGVPTNTIAGHRDYAATLCPGANLYALIADGTIKAQVDAVLAAGGVALG